MIKINIEENKKDFIQELHATRRKGIESVINWLENDSDFFIAPASTKYHLNQPGGLCQHSLNTEKLNLNNCGLLYGHPDLWPVPADSAVITGNLHDVCKANFYEPGAEFPASDGQIYVFNKETGRLRTSPENEAIFRKYFFENKDVKTTISGKVVGKATTWLQKGCPDPMPVWPYEYHVKDQFPAGHGAKSVILLQKLGLELTDQEILAITWHMGMPTEYSDQKAYSEAKKLPLVTILQISDMAASAILEADHDED
jgi:hypothetical protein